MLWFPAATRSVQRGALDRPLERWLSVPPFSRLTIAARIAAIALTLVLPLNLVIVAVIWHLSDAAGETQRSSLLYAARSVAAAVDARLDKYMALSQALAHSPALLEDKLDNFEAEARRALGSTQDGWVMVADLEGKQLINTGSKPGQFLRVRSPLGFAAQKRSFETHSTVITDVLHGTVAENWIIDVEVPIFKDGRPFRALAVAVIAQSFFRLLNDQQIPRNWLACIIDSQGRYIAHVPNNERYAGTPASEDWRELKDRNGVFDLLSVEGDPIVSAHARSTVGGWVAGIAVKKAEMQAATWHAIRWATILGGSFSVLSLLLAAAMARSIAGPLAKLRQKAGALLVGSAPSTLPQGPPEVRELWQALRQSAADRDRSDQALRESEEKLRLTLDAAQLGIWRWDAGQGTGEMEWDSRCRALFGVPADAHVTYETWANCIVAKDRARAEANAARSLNPDDPYDETICEYRVKHSDGTVRWLCSTGCAYFEPDPWSRSGRKVAFMAGAIRDVTHVHLAEVALRESEERLRLSNEAAGIGTFTADLETGCVHNSAELAAMLGVPGIRTAMIEDAFARVHRDDLWRFKAQYERSLSGLGAAHIRGTDFRFVRPGGEVRWMTWAGRVHFREGPSGQIPFRIDGACVDITERKRAEAALRANEERFRSIFENAVTGIAILDMESRFQSCNPAFSAMLGYTETELGNLSVRPLMHPDDRDTNTSQCQRLAAQEIPSFEIINRYLGKDGKSIWVHKYVSLLRDTAGRPTNILVLVADITDRKRQEDQIHLLMREVNHRSKNVLSVVQAVARRTLAANPEDFLERFGKRVEALAASQDLLVKNAWKGADLYELVRSQLAHLEDVIDTRIEIQGPALFVSASAAQAIGMALHELATNAGKYGSLSSADGSIQIAWCVRRDDRDHETFIMTWREQCAHPITSPAKFGFGFSVMSSMAEMSLGAKVELDFPVSGLTWQLSCAATEVLEGSFRSMAIP
jgi:PAS domain S-box-containing protein